MNDTKLEVNSILNSVKLDSFIFCHSHYNLYNVNQSKFSYTALTFDLRGWRPASKDCFEGAPPGPIMEARGSSPVIDGALDSRAWSLFNSS